MRILVLGCENLIGTALFPLLAQRKYDIWVIVQDKESQENFQRYGAHTILADPSENGSWIDQLPLELDYIVNLLHPSISARVSLKALENKIGEYMLQVTKNLTYIAKSRKVKRILQLANIFYYATRGETKVSEKSTRDIDPQNYGMLYKSAITHLLGNKEVNTTLLITGHFIYTSKGETFPEVPTLFETMYVKVDDANNYVQLSHCEDVVGAIDHLLAHELDLPFVNIVDDQPITQKQWIEILSHIKKVPTTISLPISFASFLMGDTYSQSVIQPIQAKNELLRSTGYWLKFPNYRAGFSSELMQ